MSNESIVSPVIYFGHRIILTSLFNFYWVNVNEFYEICTYYVLFALNKILYI